MKETSTSKLTLGVQVPSKKQKQHENQDNVSSSKISDPIVMSLGENDLEEFPTMFKKFKEDMNVLQENKTKKLNKIRKST